MENGSFVIYKIQDTRNNISSGDEDRTNGQPYYEITIKNNPQNRNSTKKNIFWHERIEENDSKTKIFINDGTRERDYNSLEDISAYLMTDKYHPWNKLLSVDQLIIPKS